MTKIKSLTIVNQQGSKSYFVGNVYNGLLLAKITNKSREFSEELVVIFAGETLCNELVFEVINAPVEIEFEPA